MNKHIIVNKMRTPDGTILHSMSVHDYVTHIDANGKEYMLDGGNCYVRSSANGDEEYLTVYDDISHIEQRVIIKWGTYGKEGKDPLKYKTIADMSDDHLEAVLLLNPAIHIRNCMLNELKYRAENHEFSIKD